MFLKQPGWTIRMNYGSDKPDYESEIFTCNHCGRNVFYRSSITGKALPPDIVDNRCKVCMDRICFRCQGGICYPRMKRIEAEEEQAYRINQNLRCG